MDVHRIGAIMVLIIIIAVINPLRMMQYKSVYDVPKRTRILQAIIVFPLMFVFVLLVSHGV